METNYTAEKIFERKFNEKFSGFSYYQGYTNSRERFCLKCDTCGEIMTRMAQIVRRETSITCTGCSKIKSKDVRDENSRMRREKKIVKNKVKSEVKALIRIKNNHNYHFECAYCGRIKFSSYPKKYCNSLCSNKHTNYRKTLVRDKRIKSNGHVDKDITLKKLAKRDGNKCYLCGEGCDWNDFVSNDVGVKICGNTYPSIDHVFPLANGGTHTWGNVRTAHRICNSKKQDRNVSYYLHLNQTCKALPTTVQ